MEASCDKVSRRLKSPVCLSYHWSMKLRVGYVDEKMSPESPLTSWWVINGWNFHSEWTVPLISIVSLTFIFIQAVLSVFFSLHNYLHILIDCLSTHVYFTYRHVLHCAEHHSSPVKFGEHDRTWQEQHRRHSLTSVYVQHWRGSPVP